MFDEIARPLAGTTNFFKTTNEARRRSLRDDPPEVLTKTAARMARLARIERAKGNEDRARAFDGLAEAHRLAASPDAVLGCCVRRHEGEIARGPGERRSDCARFSACLSEFARAEPRAKDGHCPADCVAFVPLARLRPTHRSVHLDQRASFSFGGIARTGIV